MWSLLLSLISSESNKHYSLAVKIPWLVKETSKVLKIKREIYLFKKTENQKTPGLMGAEPGLKSWQEVSSYSLSSCLSEDITESPVSQLLWVSSKVNCCHPSLYPLFHENIQEILSVFEGESSQSYGFSDNHVQMWELDHKEAEHQRIDAFEPWCWRRLLRVPWTARRSNQSILKEINPEYSSEWLMLKLNLQYFDHLM